MKARILYFMVAGLFPILAHCQLTPEDEEEIADFIDEFLECNNIPGLMLAAVREGEVILTEGYGKANTEEHEDATSKTVFCIGSTTKAFTSTMLSKRLHQMENVSWDTPVRELLGGDFFFSDGYRSNVTTLRDLLAHKMGVPRHDVMWLLDQWDRNEDVERIRFLENIVPHRSSFMYNNHMYTLAGYVTEYLHGSGASWEDILHEMILEPLGMNSTLVLLEAHPNYEGFATPYTFYENDRIEVPWELYSGLRSQAPAGGICSNAEDMAQWLLYVLDSDGPDHSAIWETFWQEQTTWWDYSYGLPDYPETFDPLAIYSRGWFDGHYRGVKFVSHGGDLEGYHSFASLLPDYGVGIFTSANFPGSIVHMDLHAFISDILTGQERWFTAEDACSSKHTQAHPPWQINIIPGKQSTMQECEAVHLENHTLEEYVGIYGNYAYGNVTVFLNEGEDMLQMEYGRNGGFDLEPMAPEGYFMPHGNRSPSHLFFLGPIRFEIMDDVPKTLRIPGFELQDPPLFVEGLQYQSAPPPSLDGCNA